MCFYLLHEFLQLLMETHFRSRMLARLALSNVRYLLSRFWRSHSINWYLHYRCNWSFVRLFFFILPNNLNCLAGWQNTNSSSFYENSYSSAWCFPCFGMLILFWVIHNEFYLFIFVGKKLDCSSSIPFVINVYT